jgi:hypothetical protein
MIKFIIAVVVVVGLALGAWQIYEYWGKYKGDNAPTATTYTPPPESDSLSGMPQNLEQTYQASKQRGVTGIRDFLTEYGKTVSDPRLASIQLDYVVLIASSNPSEARRVFALVKGRVQPDSPVYSRVQQLEKTYE